MHRKTQYFEKQNSSLFCIRTRKLSKEPIIHGRKLWRRLSCQGVCVFFDQRGARFGSDSFPHVLACRADDSENNTRFYSPVRMPLNICSLIWNILAINNCNCNLVIARYMLRRDKRDCCPSDEYYDNSIIATTTTSASGKLSAVTRGAHPNHSMAS
jgi:hypothetical protein